MDRLNWNDIRVFLEYLRAGSVNAAAQQLQISAPTVSRRINALQRQLGYPLLNRTGQSLELHENAEKLVEIWSEAERLLTYGPDLAERYVSARCSNCVFRRHQRLRLR